MASRQQLATSASNEGYLKVRNHKVGAFSWLKVATTAFTFKDTIINRHYAKQALTPWSLYMKFGPQRNYTAIRHYANQTASPL